MIKAVKRAMKITFWEIVSNSFNWSTNYYGVLVKMQSQKVL